MLLFLRAGTPATTKSLVEKLGGVTTDFVIITDSLSFQIESQAIIKRGVSSAKTNAGNRPFEEGSYGYGYGYQAWHLEFTTTDKIVEHYKKSFGLKKFYYELRLTDKDDNWLLRTTLSESEVKRVSNGQRLYTYSINLKKIPVILMEKTKHIYIAGIRNYKKR